MPVHVCTISILWNFHTNPYHPSENYKLKQQGDGAGEHLKNDKLRVKIPQVKTTSQNNKSSEQRVSSCNCSIPIKLVAQPSIINSNIYCFLTTAFRFQFDCRNSGLLNLLSFLQRLFFSFFPLLRQNPRSFVTTNLFQF